ncbi:hypothetical protein BABINDRAFT_7905 [Babjeviella inositovora NRRL Y-12698]|uniref:Ammonium transporter n=1 Tax=Babjeviella inositovora NRRL Y-12698 TaxID=984486 RepID=A0A1E3QPX1_9ASCO|nr:uncharacterized protein BABINDRAFT_7905 [Babjeviella inositovora NRRL Y-12698]ODQ79688.1 hypothetical protein BABINDRAFT_7905 [Babjeviella inositovora NRRL Y-12698]
MLQDLFKRAEGPIVEGSSSLYDNSAFDAAQLSMLAIASAMIWIMIPGLGFLYSGLARRKSALSMLWVCFMGSMVGVFQWYFWGYSLAFSATASNNFIGDLHYFGFKKINHFVEGATYPTVVYALFQMQFLMVTLAIVAGATTAERGRFLPGMVFLFLWATVVYCPVVYWVWNPNGWAAKWGVLDYAGGGPVEILSGCSGFVYSAFLGRRRDSGLFNYRAHNISFIMLGLTLLYVGWLFFNGMSCLAVSVKVPYAMMNTHLTGAFGAMTWGILDWRMEKKWSTVALCSGCISGLVAATPASGCIPLWASVVLGVVAGAVCNFATGFKYLVHVDDSLDVLAEHGVAGIVGLLFNALFGDKYVIGLDGITEHAGGWLNHNYKQLYIQFAYIIACIAYSSGVTAVLCFAINKIPGLHLRITPQAEENGVDEDQIGEFAYDYVEVRRDFLAWSDPQQENEGKVSPQQATSTHEVEANHASEQYPEVMDAAEETSGTTSTSVREKRE